MNITHNKVYEFVIENLTFGDLSKEVLCEIFKDGRVASHLLERQLVAWFPELTHIPGCKSHDHTGADGALYDAKNFTKGGLKFMPSNQLGVRRVFVAEIAHEKAKKLIYIACDIVDFPQVRVKFVDGAVLLKEYPSCKIPFGHRESFFAESQIG